MSNGNHTGFLDRSGLMSVRLAITALHPFTVLVAGRPFSSVAARSGASRAHPETAAREARAQASAEDRGSDPAEPGRELPGGSGRLESRTSCFSLVGCRVEADAFSAGWRSDRRFIDRVLCGTLGDLVHLGLEALALEPIFDRREPPVDRAEPLDDLEVVVVIAHAQELPRVPRP